MTDVRSSNRGVRPAPWVRSALVGLAAVGACAVVALGSPGVSVLQAPDPLAVQGPGLVRTGGAVAALAGLVGLLLLVRNRGAPVGTRSLGPVANALRMAAIIMLALAWLAFIAPRARPGGDPGASAVASSEGAVINPDAPPSSVPPPPDTPPVSGELPQADGSLIPPEADVPPPVDDEQLPPDESRASERHGLPSLLLLSLIVVAALVLALVRGWFTGVEAGPHEEPDTRANAEAGLEASLAEIASEHGDPRDQITAAYRRLLAALVAIGAPRQPYEAPHEHLNRTLAGLGVHPDPLHRLTELYVAAQFGHRTLTERHLAAASEALTVSLADLRRAADPGSPQAGPAGNIL